MLSAIQTVIDAWADEITVVEDWLPPGINPRFPNGTLSYRNNNPGNFVQILNDVAQYRKFPTYDAGRKWLEDDLRAKFAKYSSWTVYQIMCRYCPAPHDGQPLTKGNDPLAYANSIADALGVAITNTVSEVLAIYAVGKGKPYVPKVFKHL